MLAGTLDIQRGITRIFHVKATAKEVKYLLFLFGSRLLVNLRMTNYAIVYFIKPTLYSMHILLRLIPFLLYSLFRLYIFIIYCPNIPMISIQYSCNQGTSNDKCYAAEKLWLGSYANS